MTANRTTFGLDAFWESCDRDDISDDPLMRELCFQSDALVRYRAQILEAEEIGDDEAVALLSRHFEETTIAIRRIREAIEAKKK
ncbi:MAG TPA: hypothetical protein VGD27_06045 [Longimicrobiales bacterium]